MGVLVMEEKYRIDPELNGVLDELSEEDYSALEKSLLTDGFKGAPIMVWGDVIVDGHNRYEICNKHHIPYEVQQINFENKEEAIRWMVRQQLGRRNLNPMQRIKITEKFRPFYKKKADENKSANGGDKKSELKNSAKAIKEEDKIDVRAKCAKDAGTSTDTYSKGVKILESGNEELIQQTLKGEISINRAYNELKASQKKESEKKPDNSIPSDTKSELQDLKENKRKESAQKVREARDEHGFDSPEYEDAKQQQLDVEIQINALENAVRNSDDIEKVKQIQKRYLDYLNDFQTDIDWLLSMEFYKNDEEITNFVHSELRNCMERFKGIESLIKGMTIDDLGCIVINK